MAILSSGGTEIYQYPYPQDIDEEKYYDILYRPLPWKATTKYSYERDLVIATPCTGLMYLCVSSGISGDTQPDFPTSEKKTISDGTVTWKAEPYRGIQPEDTITSSTWFSDQAGIVLEDDFIIEGCICSVKVVDIPQGIDNFTITNEVFIESNGRTEKFHRSLLIEVKQL